MTKTHLLAFVIPAIIFFGCATGSHIVTGTARPPISPDAVKIYGTPPTNAEVVAMITASFHDDGQRATDACVKELRKQAAKLGANGVVIGGFQAAPGQSGYAFGSGFSSGGGVTTTSGGLFMNPSTTIHGTAVFVP